MLGFARAERFGKEYVVEYGVRRQPQSYSNDIRIFDRKRGTGESIWDIKRHIGYISPEMHLYFREASDTLSVVASGLHDYAGLYRKPGAEDCERARRWMEAFGIAELADCRFPALSSGEQRLVLLVRTLIKSPSLLILDEPLHGLDMSRKLQVQEAIERMVEESGATLVYVTHYMEEIPAVSVTSSVWKRFTTITKFYIDYDYFETELSGSALQRPCRI